MQLNNRIPGLPEWPPIRFLQDRNEYIVGGPHVSYRRYLLSRWVSVLLGLGYIAGALGIAAIPASMHSGTAALAVLFVLLVPFGIFTGFFPVSRLLCQWFFPRHTLVRFTPQHIIVNNQTYENAPDIPVQFRASRPHLTEGAYYDGIIEKRQKGQLVDALAYELKFRKIEMIYGSRIIPITSLADEDRAAQFAIALQLGYEQAGLLRVNPSRKAAPTTATTESSLPE